jgi:hypothetical protein
MKGIAKMKTAELMEINHRHAMCWATLNCDPHKGYYVN